MNKLLFLIIILVLLQNLAKSENINILHCKSIDNKNGYDEIWELKNNSLKFYSIKWKSWAFEIPKERIKVNENYMIWFAGFETWKLNRNTYVMTKERQQADVVQKFTYKCELGIIDELDLIKLHN